LNQAGSDSSDVLGSVSGARATPIEEAGSGKEIAAKIREGSALLKIVATPWGVEFYVVEVEQQR
jgi:hypothetical protein